MNASGKWIVMGIVVLVAVGVGGVLVNSKLKTQNSKVETQNQLTAPSLATPEPTPKEVSGKVVEVTVEGSNFKFNPSKITALRGQTVRLTFKSIGGVHDLTLDEFGVQTSQLGDGEEEEVEFVADKMGTFDYYCSVASHKSMGMVGKLVVGGE